MTPRIARIVSSESGGIQDLRARPLSTSDLLVLGLSAFRLTRLAAVDTLPPIKAARSRAIAWLGKDSSLVTEDAGEYGLCPWCIGVWVSLAVVLAYRFPLARKTLLPFAVSGLVGLLSTADSALGRIAGASVEVEIGTGLPARSTDGPHRG